MFPFNNPFNPQENTSRNNVNNENNESVSNNPQPPGSDGPTMHDTTQNERYFMSIYDPRYDPIYGRARRSRRGPALRPGQLSYNTVIDPANMDAGRYNQPVLGKFTNMYGLSNSTPNLVLGRDVTSYNPIRVDNADLSAEDHYSKLKELKDTVDDINYLASACHQHRITSEHGVSNRLTGVKARNITASKLTNEALRLAAALNEKEIFRQLLTDEYVELLRTHNVIPTIEEMKQLNIPLPVYDFSVYYRIKHYNSDRDSFNPNNMPTLSDVKLVNNQELKDRMNFWRQVYRQGQAAAYNQT
jgi:hypothetical protein